MNGLSKRCTTSESLRQALDFTEPTLAMDRALKTLDSKSPPLLVVPLRHRSRTSDVLRSLVEHAREDDLTLRAMMERLGDRTFGVMLVIMAALNVIPLVSLFTGMLVAALGLQMAAGMTRAKLPAVILDWQLPPDRVKAALLVIEPKVRAIERFVRPRWHFTEAPLVDRINGLIIAILGVIIAVPVPFTNLAPALVIIVMGLGLLERDGLVQIIALGSGLAAMALVYFLVSSAYVTVA